MAFTTSILSAIDSVPVVTMNFRNLTYSPYNLRDACYVLYRIHQLRAVYSIVHLVEYVSQKHTKLSISLKVS